MVQTIQLFLAGHFCNLAQFGFEFDFRFLFPQPSPTIPSYPLAQPLPAYNYLPLTPSLPLLALPPNP